MGEHGSPRRSTWSDSRCLIPFRLTGSQLGLAALSFTVSEKVLSMAAILRSMLADVDAGLVSTLANAIRAEAFANFLDHAVEYQKKKYKNEAGVILGVVFEDTMRKIYADRIDKVARPELE